MTVVTLPTSWIDQVNPDVLSDVAERLVDALTAVFEQFGAEDPRSGGRISYGRTVVGHGVTVPLEPAGDAGGGYQMTVCLSNGLELGEAGVVQFRYPQGSPGRFGYEYTRYTVAIAHPYPMRGASRIPTDPATIDTYRRALWWQGRLMWAALKALALGGISPALGPLAPSADQVHVGPMLPTGPRGGIAGWQAEVAVQL